MTGHSDHLRIDAEAFAREAGELRREIEAEAGEDDIVHLKKIERRGRLMTALGFATAWIAPNPISAAAISFGKTTRWLLMHHVGHRGYDRIPGVPKRRTSKGFAKGRRRFLDWPNWILPEAWIYEHNVLHHAFVNEPRDPDLVERNLSERAIWRRPMPVRLAFLAFMAGAWMPAYYAPSTLKTWRARRNGASETPNRLETPGRELLFRCLLPYAALNLVLLPAPFLLLGPWAWASVLANVIMGEMLANAHTFLLVVPNHTGDDIPRFERRPESKAEALVFQVLASANYRTGGDLNDHLHMWLNYQIEHHVWPDLSMRQYRIAQPKLKALCERHGIPYRQESVFRRARKMVEVFLGRAKAPIVR